MAYQSALDFIANKKAKDNTLQQYAKTEPTMNRNDVSLSDYIYKKLGVGTLDIAGPLAGFGSGLANTVGMDETADYLNDVQKDIASVSQGLNKEAGGSINAIQGEDSLLNDFSFKKLGQYAADLALTQAPQLLVGGAAAKAGTVLAPVLSKIPKIAAVDGAAESLAALLGTTSAMTAQETGSIYNDQSEGNKNFGKALAYGVPAGVLESVSQLHMLKRGGLGGLIEHSLADKGEKSAKRIGIDILKSTVEEGSTEGSQNVLEQMGASDKNNPIEAAKDISASEVLENAIAGVVMGGTMTGAGSISKKTMDVTKRKLRPLADRAVDELIQEAATKRENAVADGVSETSILDKAETLDDQQTVQDAQQQAENIDSGIDAAEAVQEQDEISHGRIKIKRVNNRLHEVFGPNGASIGIIEILHGKNAISLSPDIEQGFGRDTYLAIAKQFPEKAIVSGDMSPFAESMWKKMVADGIAIESEVGVYDNGEIKYEYSIPPMSKSAEKAASDLGVEARQLNSFAYNIYSSVKNAAQFTAEMTKQFGSAIKKHTIQIWNYFKKLQPGLSIKKTRDERVQDLLNRMDEVGLKKEDVTGLTFKEVNEKIDEIKTNTWKNEVDYWMTEPPMTDEQTQADPRETLGIEDIAPDLAKKYGISVDDIYNYIDKRQDTTDKLSQSQTEAQTKSVPATDTNKRTTQQESTSDAHQNLEDDWYVDEDTYVDQEMIDALDDWAIDFDNETEDGSWETLSQREKDEYKKSLEDAVNSGTKKLGLVSDEEYKAMDRYLVDKGISEDGRKALYEAHAEQIRKEDRNADYEEAIDHEAEDRSRAENKWTEGLLPEEMELDEGSTLVKTDRQRVSTNGRTFVAPEKTTPTQAGEGERDKISNWNLGGKYEAIKTLDFYLKRKAKIKAQKNSDDLNLDNAPEIAKDESYYDESTIESFENDNQQAIEQAAKEFDDRSDKIKKEVSDLEAKISNAEKLEDSKKRTKILTDLKKKLKIAKNQIDLNYLSPEDKKHNRRSLASIILHDLQTAYPEAYLPSLIKFIKHEEGIRSFAALSGYPESLTELISHVQTKDDALSENLFQEEHDQSVKQQESFFKAVEALINNRTQQDFNAIADVIAKNINIIYSGKRSASTVVVRNNQEEIIDEIQAQAKVTYKHPAKTSQKPQGTIRGLTQEERNKEEAARNAKLTVAAQKKRIALKKQEEKNKQAIHNAVLRQARANQVMISMFPDFFDIVDDILGSGKYQGIKKIRSQDIAIKLKKKNKVFSKMSMEARDNMARRMVLLVNGLGTETFKNYSTRQEIEGNPEALHSNLAENIEKINSEMSQLGTDPELDLIDDFVEYASSLSILNYTGSFIYFVSYTDKNGNTKFEDGINYKRKQELIKKYGSVRETNPKINLESPFGTQQKGIKGSGVTPGVIDVKSSYSDEVFTVSYSHYLSSNNLVAVGKPYNVKAGSNLALSWVATNDLDKLIKAVIERTDLINQYDINAYEFTSKILNAKNKIELDKLFKEFHETSDQETINTFYERIYQNKLEFLTSKEFDKSQKAIDRQVHRTVSDYAHKQDYVVSFYKMVGRAYLSLNGEQLKRFFVGLHNGAIDSDILNILQKKYFKGEKFPDSKTMNTLYKRVGREKLVEFHKYMQKNLKLRSNLKDEDFYKFFAKIYQTSLANSSRTAFVMDTLNKSLLADPELIHQLAKDYEEFGVTESDITSAYVSLGGNKIAITNYLSDVMQNHFYEKAKKAIVGYPSIKEAKDHILARSDEKIKKLSEKYWGKDKSKLDPKTIAELEAIEYVVNDISQDENTVKQPLSEQKDKPMHSVIKEIDKRRPKKSTEVATTKHSVGLEVYAEDIFVPKNELDPFEQSLVDRNSDLTQGSKLQVGTLASKLADFSYRKLASIFNADLVIVNHANGRKAGYKSRYIPASKVDGRSKLVVNVAQPVKFSHLFSHELFHHIVNRSNPEEYKAFSNQLAVLASSKSTSFKSTLEAREELRNNEEIQAELFAEVMFSSSFYDALSKTSAGKSIAAKLLKRLVGVISKVYNIFSSKEHRWSYEFDGMINDEDMKKAIQLMANLVGESLNSTTLQRTDYKEGVRYWTPFGKKNKSETEKVSQNKDKWLSGTWKKIFPKGTKNYKELMTGIEDLVVKTLKVMASIKPQGFIADFMSDKTAVKYAHWIQNYPGFHVAKARKQVINERRHVFTKYINEQVESTKELIKDGKFRYNGRIVNPKDTSRINKILEELPQLIREKMYDDIVRGQLDFTKEKDIQKAKDLGYSDEIIETYQAYKKVTDALYKEMKKVFPQLKMNASHYGQSIRWFHESNVTLDESFERILTGSDRMMKNRDYERTTRQIAEDENLVYETLDPHELFLNYVRDATRLMQFHKVVNEAIKTDHAKIFTNEKQAKAEGFKPVVDSATRVINDLLSKGNPIEYVVRDQKGQLIVHKSGQPMAFSSKEEADAFVTKYVGATNKTATVEEQTSSAKAKIAYWSVKEKVVENKGPVIFNGEEIQNEEVKYKEVKRFMTEQEALDYSASLKGETRVEASFEVAKSDDVAQIYFSEDLAKLINITLAEDKFRNGSLMGIQGKHALWVKNAMTSFEFAFSAFHFITIGIEMMSSYATWSQLNNKGAGRFVTGFNPVRAWRESREISAIVNTILTDIDYASDPAVIKRASELLGVKDVEVLDVIKQYFTAGGLLQQDPDLRSRMNQGTMRYTEGVGDHVKVVDGQVEVEYGKLSKKAMLDSFKEVFNSELEKHPNRKELAKLKTALFAGSEAGTSWLMESFIPKVKMATWVREYTLALERNADKLASGEITKEEIGRQRMKFVEDRFGEVNWKNMWMNPSYKSFLQFFFRSFTWFTGSWKALGKSSIGLGKYSWFKIKGEEVHLSTEGLWGLNVFLAHMMAVSFVSIAYQIASGVDPEVPDDEDTPLLTRLLFPRIDPSDPYARVSIPSYITEGYKLLANLGLINTEANFKKLLSGRISSIITHAYEAIYTGEDWRGVSIVNHDDNFVEQGIESLLYIFTALPISASSVKTQLETKGFDVNGMMLSMLGMTEAPAAAKRSVAANLAFSYRRKEFKGKEITPEEAELSDNIRKAAYLYGQGDKGPLKTMLAKGQISKQKYDNALKRIPYFSGKKNYNYEDPLYVALSGLSIESAIHVWEKMSDHEKKIHRPQIIKKYHNTVSRKSKSPSQLKQIRLEMKNKGIFK